MKPAQTGLTLIEVLIAVLVLAVGLLGVAGLQATGIRNHHVADQYSVAAMHAQSIAERMRANRLGVLEGGYDLVAGAAPPAAGRDCSSERCTPAETAAWDLAQWYAGLEGEMGGDDSGALALPSVLAEIRCVDAPCGDLSPRHIAVCWDPERQSGEDIERSCISVAITP